MRRRRTFAVGEPPIRVEIEEAPPRVAFKAIARLLRIIGPGLAGLLSGAGIRTPDGGIVTWEQVIKGGGAFDVANALLGRMHAIDPDELLELLDELAVGRTWLHIPGAERPVEVTSAAVLDAFMPSGFALVGLLRFALEVNMRPTLPAASTDGGSSAGETSRRPAATP